MPPAGRAPLVAFLRGVNVGGHRTFRPSALARELGAHDVVNVGAAGTFVVRSPGPRAAFRAALLERLPFATEVMLCDARHLRRAAADDPFASEPPRPDLVRFVSVLPERARVRRPMPLSLPAEGQWFVRVIATRGQLAFGVYRRHMKTIGHLGRLDALFGMPVTTRSWSTIEAVLRILDDRG